jgi:ribosomal protein S18 acetylase RimI-like enzyme
MPGRSGSLVTLAERVVADDLEVSDLPNTRFQSKLNSKDFESIFSITKSNMQQTYNTCGSAEWQWDDSRKRSELMNRKNRFLIHRNDETIVAFIVFRFLVDNGIPVVYIWEIQVVPEACSRGLGTRLMSILEKFIDSSTGIRKLSLTVLKNNELAKKFYVKLGYSADKLSPHNACYTIMSKLLKGP